MSAIIMMRLEVKRGKIKEFMDWLCWKHIVITDVHDNPRSYEFFTQPEQMGYAEPELIYNQIKDMVIDIWYSCVGDGDLKPGKNEDYYGWASCKKETEEEK